MSHLLLFYGSDLVFCLLIRNFSKEICSVTISRTTKSSFVWTTFCKTINGQKSDLFSVYAEIEMRTEKQKILATYFSRCVYLNTSLWISKCPSWFTKFTQNALNFFRKGISLVFTCFTEKTWLTENCNKCNYVHGKNAHHLNIFICLLRQNDSSIFRLNLFKSCKPT